MLTVLAGKRPRLVLRCFLHRVITLSQDEVLMARLHDLWRAIGCDQPLVVLAVAGAWLQAGLGETPMGRFLVALMVETGAADPALAPEVVRVFEAVPDPPQHLQQALGHLRAVEPRP